MADWNSYENGSIPVFEQVLNCVPYSKYRNPNLESADKIILPLSSFDKLNSLNIPNPWIFQITTCDPDNVVVSHCGVLEFGAEEGFVHVPDWMMRNLKIEEGQRVTLENAILDKGIHMKLQPHTTSFVMLPDPKEILEQSLRLFSCLSRGDTFMVRHEGKEYYIDVLEVKPGPNAICLTDTDCEVDFAPPLDYKEPERKKIVKKVEPEQEKKKGVDGDKFMAFAGKGRRLDSPEVGGGECSAMKIDENLRKRRGRSGTDDDDKQASKAPRNYKG